LIPGEAAADMTTVLISNATLPRKKLIQHSHSPCVTPSYVISKLDAFVPRVPVLRNSGMLQTVRQGEDDLWLVMDRRTNESVIVKSTNQSFVNNHFWNCVEDAEGALVIEAVPATGAYLDTYFRYNLEKPTPWDDLLRAPLRCLFTPGGSSIECKTLLTDPSVLFDYPTYNPYFKMNHNYRFFYAIAPKSSSSRWFDSIIKVDRESRAVVHQWSALGVYVTEADFVPYSSSTIAEDEDKGVLISIVYNSTADESFLAIFDATNLDVLQMHAIGSVVPFHAHGISCAPGKPCWTNP